MVQERAATGTKSRQTVDVIPALMEQRIPT